MQATSKVWVRKVNDGVVHDEPDLLAAEEPLEIRIEYGTAPSRTTRNVAVTMRTPGQDEDLARGFLFTEGIINSREKMERLHLVKEGTMVVSLAEGEAPDISHIDRNFYTTSSCGVCGKASIEAIKIYCPAPDVTDRARCQWEILQSLPDKLRSGQGVFENTGGLHGCGLFAENGDLLLLREDVGRHNALDKLIGAALSEGLLPLDRHMLMLSGRISFELVQKAIMAGIKIIAAVGAPSSLAAEMAEEWGITLVGFLRGRRGNIYSGAERILF